jgi:hypothetical protein
MSRSWIANAALCVLLSGCADESHRAGHSDAGAVPSSHSDSDVTIDMSSFTVAPGVESYRCQNFPNPFGEDVDIDRFEAHMPVGSHHMIVFFMDANADGGPENGAGMLENCSGSEFHANVFGSQTPDGIIDLPPGVGVKISKSTWLRYQLHFVNTGDTDAVATVTTKFHVAEPGTISEHAGQLLFSNEAISIAPHSPGSATKTCSVPQDVSLLGISAHMHRHAVDFVATTAGKQIYRTQSWSEPVPARFTPPFVLPANQGVTFTCSYVNNTDTPVAFGQSALTDEMCIFAGIYYPVQDVGFPNAVCF